MSVDAARGIMVAELEGELPEPREEEGPPHAGGERRQRVSVNPFWSSRAVGEAELNAMRPEGLPKVPDTGSSRRLGRRWTFGEVPVTLLREIFLGENVRRLVATRKLPEVEPGRRSSGVRSGET